MVADARGAYTSVDLARLRFATTSLYQFLFVPLTLGLAPVGDSESRSASRDGLARVRPQA